MHKMQEKHIYCWSPWSYYPIYPKKNKNRKGMQNRNDKEIKIEINFDVLLV